MNVRQVFEEMRESGVPMNTVTYNATLAACEDGRRCDLALELYDEMRASKEVSPDALTYKAVVATCRFAIDSLHSHSPECFAGDLKHGYVRVRFCLPT